MAWEVQAATKQMTHLKALSLDDMSHLFYQNYWKLVGNDVTHSVISFLNFATLPNNCNHSLSYSSLKSKVLN